MPSLSIPVITIDGPSGSGKGTISQLLATRLGFHLLDSGALYRLTALAAGRRYVDLHDANKVADVARNLAVEFATDSGEVVIRLDGDDVTRAIRRESVSMNASIIAAHSAVREALLSRQRDFQKMPGLVADGRDMGTTVFPDAGLKIFLTASTEKRAQRRYKQLIDKGESVNLSALLKEVEERDKRDMQRSASPLLEGADAVEIAGAIKIDSTSLSIDQVLTLILELVDERRLTITS